MIPTDSTGYVVDDGLKWRKDDFWRLVTIWFVARNHMLLMLRIILFELAFYWQGLTNTLKSQQNRLSDVYSMRQQRKVGESAPSRKAYFRSIRLALVGPPGPVDSVALFSTTRLNIKTVEYGIVIEIFLGKE